MRLSEKINGSLTSSFANSLNEHMNEDKENSVAEEKPATEEVINESCETEVKEENVTECDTQENLKEDEHTDNFMINILTNQNVTWKRESDGKELITSFEVFENGFNPTEYKTEEELSSYIIEE